MYKKALKLKKHIENSKNKNSDVQESLEIEKNTSKISKTRISMFWIPENDKINIETSEKRNSDILYFGWENTMKWQRSRQGSFSKLMNFGSLC